MAFFYVVQIFLKEKYFRRFFNLSVNYSQLWCVYLMLVLLYNMFK